MHLYGRLRLPLIYSNIWFGNDCSIGESVFFQSGRKSIISIGNNCSFNTGCHIVSAEKISIGNNVAIAEYVSIRDQEHKFNPLFGVRNQGFSTKAVYIGSNVWIGRGVYIGPGTEIGSGSIIGANSVVRGAFPDNVLIAGTPAKIKKYLR